jgi:hypothetical protein
MAHSNAKNQFHDRNASTPVLTLQVIKTELQKRKKKPNDYDQPRTTLNDLLNLIFEANSPCYQVIVIISYRKANSC